MLRWWGRTKPRRRREGGRGTRTGCIWTRILLEFHQAHKKLHYVHGISCGFLFYTFRRFIKCPAQRLSPSSSCIPSLSFLLLCSRIKHFDTEKGEINNPSTYVQRTGMLNKIWNHFIWRPASSFNPRRFVKIDASGGIAHILDPLENRLLLFLRVCPINKSKYRGGLLRIDFQFLFSLLNFSLSRENTLRYTLRDTHTLQNGRDRHTTCT